MEAEQELDYQLDPAYPLHHLVFLNKHEALQKFIDDNSSFDINTQDGFGNTALHVAVMLAREDCMNILLKSPLISLNIHNYDGWTALAEATSIGSKETMLKLLVRESNLNQVRSSVHRPHVVDALLRCPDFVLQFKWEVLCWIPFSRRFLPSDVCILRKRGCQIRLDTNVDCHSREPRESFIFDGKAPVERSLHVLNHDRKCYSRFKYHMSKDELQQRVNYLLSVDNAFSYLNTNHVQFVPHSTGWIWKHEKRELVGEYHSTCFSVTNISLRFIKRREHLSDADVKKNKELLNVFKQGDVANMPLITPRESLPSPHQHVSLEDYASMWSNYRESMRIAQTTNEEEAPVPCIATCASSRYEKYAAFLEVNCTVCEDCTNPRHLEVFRKARLQPCLGRPRKIKVTNSVVKATVAMSEEFPLSVSDLMDVLEVLSPVPILSRLRSMLKHKLPPGFPVKITVPVFPTMSGQVTFQWVRTHQEDEKLNLLRDPTAFEIPRDYKYRQSTSVYDAAT